MPAAPATSARPVAGGYDIVTHGRVFRLPDGTALRPVPAALAAAIADEWNLHAPAGAAPADWRPFVLTRLQATLQSLDPHRRELACRDLSGAADAEPLCYLSDATRNPHRQAALAWAGGLLGEPFETRAGIMPFAQHPRLHLSLDTHLAGLAESELTATIAIRAATGSLVLALALVHRHLDPAAAAAAALAEEEPGWRTAGDPEPHRGAVDALCADLTRVVRFLDLTHPSPTGVTQS